MRRIRIRRLPPALVVACIALGVALGGTSYATVLNVPRASVGTPQLKNGAVTSAKVQNRSLLRADFRPGQLPAGPTGPRGPAGAPGPAGPAGPAGTPGLSAVERVETTTANNSTSPKTAQMACPTGKRLIGGGARLNTTSNAIALQQSFPDNDNIFRASAREVNVTGANWSLTVFAICANAS